MDIFTVFWTDWITLSCGECGEVFDEREDVKIDRWEDRDSVTWRLTCPECGAQEQI